MRLSSRFKAASLGEFLYYSTFLAANLGKINFTLQKHTFKLTFYVTNFLDLKKI